MPLLYIKRKGGQLLNLIIKDIKRKNPSLNEGL